MTANRLLQTLAKSDWAFEPGPPDSWSAQDWNRVLERADRRGLTARLFKSVQAEGRNTGIPPDCRNRLRTAYFAAATRGARLHHEIRNILKSLSQPSIPVIMLKGASMMGASCDWRVARRMYDIDLLVRHENLGAIGASLAELGYSPDFPPEGGSWPCPSFRRPRNDLSVFVELHEELADPPHPFEIDVESVWSRAEPVGFADTQALVLATEDQLLHLCIHFAYHHVFDIGPRPLFDIADVVENRPGAFDWKVLAARARDWRAGPYAGLALGLAQTLAGAAVPPEVVEELAFDGFALAQRLAGDLTLADNSDIPNLTPITELLAGKSIRTRARVFFRSACRPARALADSRRADSRRSLPGTRQVGRFGRVTRRYLRDSVRILRLRSIIRRANPRRSRLRSRGHAAGSRPWVVDRESQERD